MQVKEAYMKLTDEVLKKNLLMHIENATDEYKKERRKLLAKGVRNLIFFLPYRLFFASAEMLLFAIFQLLIDVFKS